MRSKSSKSPSGRQARTKSRRQPEILPPALAALEEDLFGPPDLLPSEDRDQYERLLAGVSAAVAPEDAVERIWVRDVVDITWEIHRLKTYKTRRLFDNYADAIEKALVPKIGSSNAREAAEDWRQSEGSKELQSLEGTFAELGMDWKGVAAAAYVQSIGLFERFDAAITSLEFRRSVLFRDMEKRREALARRTRESMRDLEGDCVDVMPVGVILAEPSPSPSPSPSSQSDTSISSSGSSSKQKGRGRKGGASKTEENRSGGGGSDDEGDACGNGNGNGKRHSRPKGRMKVVPVSHPGLFDREGTGSAASGVSDEGSPASGRAPLSPPPASKPSA